jgi:hypothetical protein
MSRQLYLVLLVAALVLLVQPGGSMPAAVPSPDPAPKPREMDSLTYVWVEYIIKPINNWLHNLLYGARE